ncbi:MAG: chemotaxis protein CheW [Polyangiales bacterium]
MGFRVDGLHYALSIDAVREIIRPLNAVELPHLPTAVVGVADHRGAVVPIVDLRRLFGRGASSPTNRTKWVVVGRGENSPSVGLIVDSVIGVFGVTDEASRAAPPWAQEQIDAGMGDVVSRDDELVFVLDVDAVMDPHLRALARAKMPERLP